MSQALLQEETKVPQKNLQSLVKTESNWTTIFSCVTKATLNRQLQGGGIEA